MYSTLENFSGDPAELKLQIRQYLSQSASLGAWLCGPRGNTPTGNSGFPTSSCASCSARSISLSKRWNRRGAGIELNYRYLTA